MANSYFQALPKEKQHELGKVASDAFIHFEPPFQWKGTWADMDSAMQNRWMAVAESIFTQLQGLEEYVTTRMDLFNEAHRVLDDSVKRFEAIRPDDAGFNNYQLLEWLRSAHAEIINARLLMLRADIVAGNVHHSGDESTVRVSIPNVQTGE